MTLLISYLPLFLHSIGVTLWLSLCTLLLSTVLAILLAIGVTARIRAIRWLFIFIVEFIRAIPIFVLVLAVYFVVPMVAMSLDPFTSTVISLSLWGGANGAEIIRGGLSSIDHGQKEAGNALGFHPILFFVLVIVPQVVRIILPPYCGLATTLIQATTLGSVVGVVEFLRTGQIVIERSALQIDGTPSLAIYGGMLIVYYLICYTVSKAGLMLEKRLSRHIRRNNDRGQRVPADGASSLDPHV